MRIIVAPHADDEIIGCYSVLKKASTNDKPIHIIYINLVNHERMEEAKIFCAENNAIYNTSDKDTLWQALFSLGVNQTEMIVYAPDPHWELHPDHKIIGTLVKHHAKALKYRFCSYSTNMNVPYLRELTPTQMSRKKEIMDTYFPSQKSLWEHDHRYFLFEGICEWNSPA